MGKDYFKTVFDKHKTWLESRGRDGERADFSEKDLSMTDLSGVNLSRACFIGTNLHKSSLRFSGLKGTDFTGADITGANFFGTALYDTNFTDAVANGSNFTKTHFGSTILTRTNFAGAIVRGQFSYITFDHTNFYCADLSWSKFYHTTFGDDSSFHKAKLFGVSFDCCEFNGVKLAIVLESNPDRVL